MMRTVIGLVAGLCVASIASHATTPNPLVARGAYAAVSPLIDDYHDADDGCRGSTPGAAHDIACRNRTTISKHLARAGWCYGQDREYEYQKTWAPCYHHDAIQDATAVPEETGAVRVSAAALAADFKRNAVAAEERYAGHRLIVDGTVAAVDKTPFGMIYIRFEGEVVGPRAYVDGNGDTDVSRLVRCGPVTVNCASVQTSIFSPALDGCSLVDK